MWKNILELARPHMTITRMLIACCITKAANTHLEYVIITDLPLQQWLHERVSMLRYTYTAYRVFPVSEVTLPATLQICRGLHILHLCSALLLSASDVTRNFFRGWGFNIFSWGQRAERTGIGGRQPPSQGFRPIFKWVKPVFLLGS
jgi:hypothetical protein